MELAPQMLRVLGENSPYITKDVYKRIVNPELLKIYKYDEYREYMKYYNELFYYIMSINKRFKEYTNVRGCHI